MFDFHHLALGAILALPLAYAAVGLDTFEVDLIFPQNGTYAPVPLMPVVFALQNPALASPLGARISWTLYEYGKFGSGEMAPEIDLSGLNASNSNPYLVTSHDFTLSGIESTWIFTWALKTDNCSQSGPQVTYHDHQQFIVFTTNKTAQAPDLEAASSSATCAMSQGEAFNVTAVKQVGISPDLEMGQSSCAILGPSPTTRDPCAATIDSSAASSITAAMSRSLCLATQGFNCTATPTSTTSLACRSFHQWTMGALTALGLLLLWNY